ncbi:MAG TPA: dihydroorotase [Leptolyngbyaceae cyanobacterium M33_DOE_097]|uniref:Dihydroorotase n=1 Tax=Oscillatoriales cyanobacterium SpSt-418 TaxID=2282169 RepID=A0A7C3KHC3_9CYAN|nr:dihydroorotase [Leptolyngbyaceae cyanobacterium M33_DOE_097]
MHELLQQVRLLDPITGHDRVVDILLEDAVVRAIANSLSDIPAETVVHDCQGMVAGPGLIDLYSYSGEPGHEERETLDSLMQAAISGGFTQLNLLPKTHPALDNPATISWLYDQVQNLKQRPPKRPSPQVKCWAALTQDVKGQQMTELAELAGLEIAGFADGEPIANLVLLRRLLEYLKPLQKPLTLWASDPGLVGSGVMREGEESIVFGLPGIPAIAETTALAAILECVAEIGTPVHLMRVSTARSVELIRQAKARHLPVTASTTWMHLLFNSQAIASYDPNLRLSPPLGNAADQEALLAGLQDGTVDAIAVDHTPHTYEDKTVAFAEAPSGVIGLELTLPLLWDQLVQPNHLSALTLWQCLSLNPARCLQQPFAPVEVDQAANLILFDPQQTWTADTSFLHSRSHNTPWFQRSIPGRVTKVWCAA